jgi:hypothetical protein
MGIGFSLAVRFGGTRVRWDDGVMTGER